MSKVSWPPKNYKVPSDKETRSFVFNELLKSYVATMPANAATVAKIRILTARWRARYNDARSD
jgi:hypothetical protein